MAPPSLSSSPPLLLIWSTSRLESRMMLAAKSTESKPTSLRHRTRRPPSAQRLSDKSWQSSSFRRDVSMLHIIGKAPIASQPSKGWHEEMRIRSVSDMLRSRARSEVMALMSVGTQRKSPIPMSRDERCLSWGKASGKRRSP